MRRRKISIIGVSLLLAGIAIIGVAKIAKPSDYNLPQEIEPSLIVEVRDDAEFAPGTRSATWRLRGYGIKRLRARLVVFVDGQQNKQTEIDCEWDSQSVVINGRLTLLVQTGQPFGVPEKWLPSFDLQFSDGRPQRSIRLEKRPGAILVNRIGEKISHSSGPGSLLRRDVVHAEVSGEVVGRPFQIIDSEVALAEASKDGRVALAVFVEWIP